jgi:hypothetical protein
MAKQLPPTSRSKAPQVDVFSVQPKECGSICKYYAAGLHHSESVPETGFEFTEERKSTGQQNTIVSFGLQDIFRMGEIATNSAFAFRIYVKGVDLLEIVAISMSVNIRIDFKNISGYIDAVSFEKPVHVISIDRCASIPSIYFRERLHPTQVSPPGKF